MIYYNHLIELLIIPNDFQIGVEGGVKELIKHYENDVFGRRDKMLKKCHHLQKTIDQYVERMQRDPKIKNRTTIIVKEDLEKEKSTNEQQGIVYEDNVLLSENKFPMELMTEEDRTGIQSTFEDVIGIDAHLMTEENAEIEHGGTAGPVYCTSNVDVEVKDGRGKNAENIKIDSIADLLGGGDRKINYKRTATDAKIADVKFDLLAPLVVKPFNVKLAMPNYRGDGKNLISIKDSSPSTSSSRRVKLPDFLKKSMDNNNVRASSKTVGSSGDDEVNKFDEEFKRYKSRLCDKHTKKITRRARLVHCMRGFKVGRRPCLDKELKKRRRASMGCCEAGPSNKKRFDRK